VLLTRRSVLGMLAGPPLAAAGGCCGKKYPKPVGVSRTTAIGSISPILQPAPRATRRIGIGPIIDVHAHFFNASDVPLRGFLQDCLGHRASPPVYRLLEALAPLTDAIADRAPTAADEIGWLRSLMSQTSGLSAADVKQRVEETMSRERAATAKRVADVVRGSDFERVYLQMKSAAARRLGRPTLSENQILTVVMEAQNPSLQPALVAVPRTGAQMDADRADGILGFLFYLLSRRSSNLDTYIGTFQRHERAFGIDMVLGALVDFDYWLDCPPRSAQDDQVALHALLAELHGGYLRPIVAYNPWTDINQSGAGLARVVKAFNDHRFVGVKIYPPMGFLPAGNASASPKTMKHRPDLKRLDAVLEAFFDKCAELRIPIIAHAARSNGRDDAHDEFGGPGGWATLLGRYASKAATPIIDVGHFGGGAGSEWTQEFSLLMRNYPRAELYGDLGYWEELMCPATPDAACGAARNRLKDALRVSLSETETVADRAMFGTDWLMLSQVKRWADYPANVLESVEAIASANDAARIFGRNAEKCFRL
jgi:predicted TIM-barrel fold metal-dependent hydrolase